MTTQSDVFALEEADRYFERNTYQRGFIADYILSLFPKRLLNTFDVAEFGIGGGQNLLLLKNYAHSVHGYDVSQKGIECFKQFFQSRPDQEDFYAANVNLCKPFSAPHPYHLVLYGFFAYYVTEKELDAVKENLLRVLNPGGYIFVHDFLVRAPHTAPDRHNPKLNVHKRDLKFWLQHLSDFDLIDFRLFNNDTAKDDRFRDEFHSIDPSVSNDDMQWNFGALFRHRDGNTDRS